jgi:WD40 repeat protein
MYFFELDPLKGRGLQLATIDAPWLSLTFFDVSPDGNFIAWSVPGAIRVLSLKSGKTQELTYKGLSPADEIEWSRDGMGLFAGNWAAAGGPAELLHIDLHGNVQTLWKTSYGVTWGIPSPDGHHLAIEGGTQDRNAWIIENF